MTHVTCDYCGQPPPLVTGKEVYPHRPDLWSKKFYQCEPCDARVGCHPPKDSPGGGIGDGTVPLGRLANAELPACLKRHNAAMAREDA